MSAKIAGPSLKVLKTLPNIAVEDAKVLKACMDGEKNVYEECDARRLPADLRAAGRVMSILSLANKMTGGFGVEYASDKHDGCGPFRGLEYVNQGDSYARTLIYDYKSGRFKACSVGDIVEASPNRFE